MLESAWAGPSSLHEDRVAHGPIGRLDPRSRVLAAFGFALAVVSLGHLAALGLALLMAAGCAVLARLGAAATLRRLLALDGLMVVVLVMLPFTVPGAPVAAFAGLEATREGLHQAGAIMLKANAVALMMLALLGSMDPVVLGRTLARLGVSGKMVQLYLFTVRYLDRLHREYRRLRTAMRARAFVMRTDRHTWRALGYLFGMLLVRSLERSERILQAMRCRGFDGQFPSLNEPGRFRRPDGLFALASAAGMLALTLAEIG
jgi:cobalt/nickel transport system permease protein